MPPMIENNSSFDSFSLIKIKASNAPKKGPVVKLIVLDRANGINLIAENYIVFEAMFNIDLKKMNLITPLS